MVGVFGLHNLPAQSRWKIALGRLSIPSRLSAILVGAFLIILWNVDLHGWQCVAHWCAFDGVILFTSPAFIVLPCWGEKVSEASSPCRQLDCIAISMMA
jgi:hypothetical protein